MSRLSTDVGDPKTIVSHIAQLEHLDDDKELKFTLDIC
jgi:hypothetical protein